MPAALISRLRVSLSVVSYLVVHGADINAVDDEGKTPLDWAIEVDRLDVAELALHTTLAHSHPHTLQMRY